MLVLMVCRGHRATAWRKLTCSLVRQSAKELTSLIMDEDRLRLERSDRKSWKTRVTGLDEEGSSASGSYAPPEGTPTRSRQNKQRRTNPTDDDDLEFKLALEASKNQAEEDAKRRTSTVPSTSGDDDDLAKAIKLSQEEDEARRRKLEEQNAVSLFDDSPTPIAQQPQATGWNQGYQQQSAVDWFGNPIDQQQPQSTGYLNNSYMQQAQQTGYQDAYGYGQQQQQYMQPQQTGYQAQYMQPQQTAYMQPQQTGFNNPYAQQQMTGFGDQNQQAQQPGHNNPFAANGGGQDGIKPQPTGSNNPFASAAARQPSQPSTPNRAPTLSTLQEQRTAMQYSAPPPQKEMDPHQARLNALLASGEGMDTFGNTGNSRIPAQHTAPGTFVNSSGANTNRLVAEKTGTNPFLHNQFTGAPQQQPQQTGFQPQYGQQQQFQQQPQGYGQQGMMPMQTGPAGLGGYGGGGGYQAQSANPFGQQRQQQQQPQGPSGGSLIDL
jgi:epsin